MVIKSLYFRSKVVYTVIISVVLLALGCVFYLNAFNFKSSFRPPIKSFREIEKLQNVNTANTVIYPLRLKMNEEQIKSNYGPFLDTSDGINFLQQEESATELMDQIMNQDYHNHKISMYGSSEVATSRFSSCKVTRNDFNISISEPKKFENNMEYAVKTLIYHLKNDPAFAELEVFFGVNDLEKHIKEKSCDKHWYKFAGTSVFLKEYGVHLMISRMVYTPSLLRKDAILSLIYAQVYNQEWEELQNVELILPNFDEEPVYEKVRFPRFLATPFYHDSTQISKRWYGPEDARILLINNKYNMEEPLIIFNAFHRKLREVKKEKGFFKFKNKAADSEFEYFRSIFMSWPLRTQVGKVNVDGTKNKTFDSIKYNKVTELRRKDATRLPVQKNWSPFTSFDDKKVDGYDKSIYFIYEWEDLKVLKCPLDNFIGGVSDCDFVYKSEKKEGKVGPLRGGTELISIKNLNSNIEVSDDVEVWVGIARAHLTKCGCGNSMYRPNLVVLSRERRNFKVLNVSSFFSLDIDVIGWKVPEERCVKKEPSVLIPNGISSWSTHSNEENKPSNDYVGITLSAGDSVDYIIYVKDLLLTLWKNMNIENYGKNAIYNDNPIYCAIKQSKEYCAEYGSGITRIMKNKVKNF